MKLSKQQLKELQKSLEQAVVQFCNNNKLMSGSTWSDYGWENERGEDVEEDFISIDIQIGSNNGVYTNNISFG